MKADDKRHRTPLLVFLYFGIAGLVPDVDHVVVHIQKGLPITLENLFTRAGRPWHFPMFYLSGAFCLACFAYLVGLLISDKRGLLNRLRMRL